jgi:hypothetical protein
LSFRVRCLLVLNLVFWLFWVLLGHACTPYG